MLGERDTFLLSLLRGRGPSLSSTNKHESWEAFKPVFSFNFDSYKSTVLIIFLKLENMFDSRFSVLSFSFSQYMTEPPFMRFYLSHYTRMKR
jgi:hypothetical protein